jgi:hypothetical protein
MRLTTLVGRAAALGLADFSPWSLLAMSSRANSNASAVPGNMKAFHPMIDPGDPEMKQARRALTPGGRKPALGIGQKSREPRHGRPSAGASTGNG